MSDDIKQRLRNKIGSVDMHECGDNLAIALCTYLSDDPRRPENDAETENGWGTWVEEQCNAALDRAVAAVYPEIEALEARVAELYRDNQRAAKIIDAARAEAEALRERLTSAHRIIASYHKGRCYACGWPLAESQENGCIPGDCSFRPSDRDSAHGEWYARMKEVDAAREGGE
ncbi:MAG: hypothetical protein AB7F22_30175 [Reyranella sp.]|uniref:hypothetical protein n=1 Tax=Reyranella sp. TaxID=1929291 RepID=UPI003D0CBD62